MTAQFDDAASSRPQRPETLSDLTEPPPAAPTAAAPQPATPQPATPATPTAAAPPAEPQPSPGLNEPTDTFPTVKPLKAAARAVIVYQETARRPWRLWAFTAVLVALTVGVILGQTVAFEPTYRSNANANAAVVPSPAPSPSASTPAWPDAAHRVTAPLGHTKSRVLVLTGPAAILHVRSADLGKNLYDVATVDRSAVPRMTVTKQAATLDLIPTGDDGTVGAEIQLNSRVAWTLKLAGGLNEQSIDMQAGGLAGLDLTGGSAHTALLLPAPKGTVRLSVEGPLADLNVTSRSKVHLRLKLTDGAGSAVVNGQPHPSAKPGTTITTSGWGNTKNRYDLTTTGKVAAALITTAPPAR